MARILDFKRKISNVVPLRAWAREKVVERQMPPPAAGQTGLIKIRLCENCRVTQAADNSNLCGLCRETKISQSAYWLNK